MKFELWEAKDETGTALSFICVDAENYQQNINLLEAHSKLIWTTVAKNYDEAMQKYYDFMDWGKYEPLND